MTTATATTATSSTLANYEAPDPFKPVGKKTLDRSDFMTLFITQMRHQDPMEPMDSSEMASQLAQFSNMEATMKMSDNMEKLLNYQVSQNNLQLLSLVDKEVQAFNNRIGVVDGAAKATEFELHDAAATCMVEIYDSAGRMVDSVNLGYQESGKREFLWDGKTPKGDQVADGLYTYKVNAMTQGGQKVEVDARSTGKVTGLEFNGGKASLTVDNAYEITVAEVISVR